MVEHSLNWIITRNLVSGKYVFIQDSLNFHFLNHILVKSLEGSFAISHTQLKRIAFRDSRNLK